MLEVVKDQHPASSADHGSQAIDQSLVARFAHPERLSHRRRDQVGIGDRCERDKDDVVWIAARKPNRTLNRDPRLADAARTGQRDEPSVTATEQIADRFDFSVTPNELR
jgi:hypothetical protein